jgi:CubicO group peptidase (beta-lactamase class C family)
MTSVALLQYVEQGKVNVDAPLASILPEFKDLKMLVGFEEDGKPKEVPAPRQPTVREVMSKRTDDSFSDSRNLTSSLTSLAN